MTASETVEEQLVHLMPVMRVWALRLTRNTVAADDLVQDVAAKVLVNRNSFIPGTNFKAWVHRITMNHFITNVRTQRTFVSIDEIISIPVAAEQHNKMALDRLSAEFTRLPDYLQDTLYQIAIEQRSYEEVSKISGCAIGTLKSRVHRARCTLRARLDRGKRLAA